MEIFADRLDVSHDAFNTEYTTQKAQETGAEGFRKLVPKNVAAARTYASQWNDLFPNIPLRGTIQNRVSGYDVNQMLVAGWEARRENNAHHAVDIATINLAESKRYLGLHAAYANVKDLLVGVYLLYDEVVAFPGNLDIAHVTPIGDPNLEANEDALIEALKRYADACTTSYDHLPYSLDYLTWIPAAAVPADRNWAASTATHAAINEHHDTLTLATIRGWNNEMLDTFQAAIPNSAKKHVKRLGKLRALVTKSSTQILNEDETSQVRAYALDLLGFICENWATYMGLEPKNQNLCTGKTYISLHANEIPLSGTHSYATLVHNEETGQKKTEIKKCKFVAKHAQCEPENLCAYEYHRGDFYLTQSCRAIDI